MYQLDDLGLARASVQIVFSSVKRRSIQKLQHPPPLPPPRKLPRHSFKFPSPGAKIMFKRPTQVPDLMANFFLQKTRSVDMTLL